MRRIVAAAALLVASLAASSARAQEPTQEDESPPPRVGALVDAQVTWLDHPPPFTFYTPGKYGTRIGGLPDDFVPHEGPVYALAIHLSARLSLGRNVVLPVFGIGAGIATGGYADGGRAGASTFQASGPLTYVALDLPGIGLRTESETFRAMISVVPTFDVFIQSGTVSDGTLSIDATGKAIQFSLRAQAELCVRGDLHAKYWCAVGGPTFFAGGPGLTGGFVGIGASF